MKSLQLLLVVSLGVILVSSVPLEPAKRLIKYSEYKPAVWMTEEEIWTNFIARHLNFVDITDHQESETLAHKAADTSAIPTTTRFQTETRRVLGAIDNDRIYAFVEHFSSYHNRYYQAQTGIDSQKWLLAQVQDSIRGYAAASVKEFDHTWTGQKSVVARIEGSDPTLKSEVIVIGAHQDSINIYGSSLAAPGADDNAAGSVVVLESLRAIVNSNFIPKRTIEFHWYAAEEVGLRGSAAIAQKYYNDRVNVVGMINLDVPGYYNGRDEIGIYTDNVDATLTNFLRILVDEYLVYGRRDARCGYGCSDHASFTRYNFPAAMPAEVTLHPQMHTANDNLARVGFPQVQEFVKLGVSALVEFGEPSN